MPDKLDVVDLSRRLQTAEEAVAYWRNAVREAQCQVDVARDDLKAARRENERLREALRPFVAVNIPENWPGQCVLDWRVGESLDGEPFAYIGFLYADAQGGPVIDDYRKAKEVIGD